MAQRLRLQRITHTGAGAVCLDIPDQCRIDTRLLDHPVREALL
ncbi:Uncharacterised protein [Mycobacteroides abscessus subsp. abscessus]|nr:Uncharacterised protein [Mycobacteroides abscessus subsp. abscessus]